MKHQRIRLGKSGRRYANCSFSSCYYYLTLRIRLLPAFFLSSFITERGNRIDASGPPSGEVACDHGNYRQHRDRHEHGLRVARTKSEQQAPRDHGADYGEHGSNRQANAQQRSRLTQNHGQNLSRSRAQRHSDADLVCSPYHHVGDHAVKANLQFAANLSLFLYVAYQHIVLRYACACQ